MHADFSVELGHDDPVLEIPWASADGSIRYYDLKKYPELIQQIPEAIAHPEINAFLTRINADGSPLETAKCDAWLSHEIAPEEEIFGGDRKFVSYIDILFVDETVRNSFARHEEYAKELCCLLNRAPDIAATIELVIRRCYYHQRGTDQQNESDQISRRVQGHTTDHQASLAPASPQDSAEASVTPVSFEPQTPSDLRASLESPASESLTLEPQTLEPLTSEEPRILTDPNTSFRDLNAFLGNSKASFQDLNVSLSNPDASSNPNTSSNPYVSCNPNTSPDELNMTVTGFYFTAYVAGFGDSNHDPISQWAIAISLLQHALMQLSRL